MCSTPFTAIKSNQYFCSRKCFKKDYNARKREERKVDRETNPARFGWYLCSHCGSKTPLPYSPKRYKTKFENYECPVCEIPRFKNTNNMREDWDWDQYHWNSGWGATERMTIVTTVTVVTTVITNSLGS